VYVSPDNFVGRADGTSQQCLERIPARRRRERQPVGVPLPDGLGQRALRVANDVHPPELKGRQVIVVIRIGEPVDGCRPSFGGRCHPKMI
jgi:hypothetical protein